MSIKLNEKWITILNKDNTSFLRKQYNFKTFKQSIKFINDDLVPITKKLKHHPKIILEYNKLTIELTTHDAPYNNNIGDLDKIFAEKLDQQYNSIINNVVLKDK
ncbi:hypothetical protein ACO0SA_004439 [Hanseniaspora valbyensis]